MHHRIRSATAAALAAALLALAACSDGGGSGEPSTTGSRGPIDLWYSSFEPEAKWALYMVEEWNKEHPDEKINAEELPGGDTAEEVIGAAITAGNVPCLVLNLSPAAAGQFEKMGGLVNLSDFPDADQYVADRSGESAEQFRNADGDLYQFPWKVNPVMLFFNKTMFTEAGLDAENPDIMTYDKFLAAGESIKANGIADYMIYPAPTSEFYKPFFDYVPTYAAESDGTQFIESGVATFGGADGVAAGEFWRSIYDKGLAGREPYQGDAFYDGIAATSLAGPWAISYYGDTIDWGVLPMPTTQEKPADEKYTFGDAKNVGLFTACENKTTAWDVLKFATSEEMDGSMLDYTGQMPLRGGLSDLYPDYFAANPAYEIFADQVSRTIEAPPSANAVEMLQVFRDAYTESVIFGKTDVASSFEDAANKINALETQ